MEIFTTIIKLQFFVSVCWTMNSSLFSTEDHQSFHETTSIVYISSLEDSINSSSVKPTGVVTSSEMPEYTTDTVQSSDQLSASETSEIITMETAEIVHSVISVNLSEFFSNDRSMIQGSKTQERMSVSDTKLFESINSSQTVNIEPTESVPIQKSQFSMLDMSSSSFEVKLEPFLPPSSLELKPSTVVSYPEHTMSQIEQMESDGTSASLRDIIPTKTVTSSEFSVAYHSSVSVYLNSSETLVSSVRTQNRTSSLFSDLSSSQSGLHFSDIMDSMTISYFIESSRTAVQSTPSILISSSVSDFIIQNPTSSLKMVQQVTQSMEGASSAPSSESQINRTSILFDIESMSIQPSLAYSPMSNFTKVGGLPMTTHLVNMSKISSFWITPRLTTEPIMTWQTSVLIESSIVKSTYAIIPTTSGEFGEASMSIIVPSVHNETVGYLDNITCEIRFSGNCDLLIKNKVVLGEFWEAFVIILSDVLLIKQSTIKPKDITCKPIRLSFTILDVQSPNLSKKLEHYVNTGQLSLPILLDTSLEIYTAIAIDLYPKLEDKTDDSDIFMVGLRQVDIIVIISACLISLILICLGFFICAREYYYRKRTRTFDLSDVVHWNMNLEDYTLTKIPRPKASYNDKGVKMNSFRRKNGCNSQEFEAQVENIPSSEAINSNILSDVQVRMDSNSNGLVVGVTGTSDPLLPANQQSPTHSDKSCDKQYGSDDNLYEQSNSPLRSVDNPIYYADDERFSSV